MFDQHPNSIRDSRSFEMEEKKGPSVSIVSLPDNDSRILLPTSDQQRLTPSNWPSQPEPLRESRVEEVWLSLYDAFLCILPLAIMVKTTLCIIAYNLDRRLSESTLGTTSGFTSVLTAAMFWINEQMVTAFTILFITIVSTLMRRYTLWEAQRGAYVSDLEQLHASISLPSTIKMIFYLRKFTFFSLGLLAVWSFYYIGSQASKREYVQVLSDPFRDINISYPNANNYFDFAQIRDESVSSDPIMQLNNLFKINWGFDLQSGMDICGFLLIPDVHQAYNAESGKMETRTDQQLRGPVQVNPDAPVSMYRSYAGRRMNFRDADAYGQSDLHTEDLESWSYIGNLYEREGRMLGRYTFETSYLDVSCGFPSALPSQSFPAGTAEFTRTTINLTSSSISTIDDVTGPQSFEIWNKWDSDHCDGCPSESPTIENMANGTIRVLCNVTRPIVQIFAECPEAKGACIAGIIRYLGTYAMNPFTNATWAAGFFDNLLWSTGYPEYAYRNDTVVAFDIGTYDLPSTLAKPRSDSDMAGYMDDFSTRLTKLVNTYFNSADDYNMNPETNPSGYDYFVLHGAVHDLKNVLSWPWICLDYLACGVLFAASVISFWLRKQTLAPDIFGYVSSLTRDNPYIPVTDGGSTLSGIDRAKYMEKVKIRIGDVGQGSEVGKIGIVYMHDGAGVDPLRKERKYL